MTTTKIAGALNLCEALVLMMMAEGFSENSIRSITQDSLFQGVLKQPIEQQRAVLVTVLRKRFLLLEKQPPKTILLALNLAHEPKAWLADVRDNVLRFMKANESAYFPA